MRNRFILRSFLHEHDTTQTSFSKEETQYEIHFIKSCWKKNSHRQLEKNPNTPQQYAQTCELKQCKFWKRVLRAYCSYVQTTLPIKHSPAVSKQGNWYYCTLGSKNVAPHISTIETYFYSVHIGIEKVNTKWHSSQMVDLLVVAIGHSNRIRILISQALLPL